MVTKIDALNRGVFHDDKCNNWRANGQVKTWKRSPFRFRVPVKHGLYRYDAITDINGGAFHVPTMTCKKNAS